MLVDLAVLAGFIAVALRSERFWPLVGRRVAADHRAWPCASRRSTSTCSRKPMPPRPQFWGYPILLIIVVGTWRSHRRQSRRRKCRANARLASCRACWARAAPWPLQPRSPTPILDALDEPALIVGGAADAGRQRAARDLLGEHDRRPRHPARHPPPPGARDDPGGPRRPMSTLVGIGAPSGRGNCRSARSADGSSAGPADRPLGGDRGRADAGRFRRQRQPRTAHAAGDHLRLCRNAGRGRAARRRDARAVRRDDPQRSARGCCGSSRI